MTVNKLSKILEKMVSGGMGKLRVFIDGNTFPIADESSVFPVVQATEKEFNVADGDGWTVTLKDGAEKRQTGLILRGEWARSK
jgi:hypothetical protein